MLPRTDAHAVEAIYACALEPSRRAALWPGVAERLGAHLADAYARALDRAQGWDADAGPDGVFDGFAREDRDAPSGALAFESLWAADGDPVLAHLRRAVALRRCLAAAEHRAEAAWAALDTVHHAVLLLDRQGTVLHANAAARALLAEADGLDARTGRLAAGTPGLTATLDAALRRASGEQGSPVASAVRLTGPSGSPGLTAIAMPLPAGPFGTGDSGQACVILCVSGAGAVAPADLAHVARLFGLTPAEVSVAAGLMAGQDLAEIAGRTGRGIATVRTHLARLMGKTETGRQSALIRLLLTIPRAGDGSSTIASTVPAVPPG